jgi:hypothetical protein
MISRKERPPSLKNENLRILSIVNPYAFYFGILFVINVTNTNFEIIIKHRKMKNLILLTAFVFGFSAITVAQSDKITLSSESKAKMSLEKNSHDFGSIQEGVQATVTFTFKNTGNAPLVLNSVKASCGCTTPKWTKEPIAPGTEGVITAIYNSKGRPGNFTKTITVKHNGDGGTEFLTIRGVVDKVAMPLTPTVVAPSEQ